jgi:hypothetical protein
MPSLGLIVSFDLVDGKAKEIKVTQNIDKNEQEPSSSETTTQESDLQEKEQPKQEEQEEQEKQEPHKSFREEHPSQSSKKESSVKKTNPTKYKNKNLEKLSDELNALLNDSSDNLDILDEQISLSMDIADTMQQYFENLKEETMKRQGYKKVNGRLDYTLAKRFLWTTFNNLTEIDDGIVTLRIGSISQDLKYMSKIKDDFDRKVRYPLSAFEEVFLKSQQEYALIKQMTVDVTDRLILLKSKEEKLNKEKIKKKHLLSKIKDKEQKQQAMKEFKTLNGTYVDVIHMMAKLQEIHEKNTKRLNAFEETYRESFYEKFQNKALKHQKTIVEILDAQAYLLDFLLWKEAKTSEAILGYFRELSIDIELNTKTYLQYYLGTLDEGKVNSETKELFQFYDYLVEHQKNYVLILTSDVQQALDYTQYIKNKDKNLCVKSFISELESLKWAMSHAVKIIVIEDTLISTSAQQYLEYYHTHIFSKPKIILMGNSAHIKSTQFTIHSVLPKDVQPRRLIDTITTFL